LSLYPRTLLSWLDKGMVVGHPRLSRISQFVASSVHPWMWISLPIVPDDLPASLIFLLCLPFFLIPVKVPSHSFLPGIPPSRLHGITVEDLIVSQPPQPSRLDRLSLSFRRPFPLFPCVRIIAVILFCEASRHPPYMRFFLNSFSLWSPSPKASSSPIFSFLLLHLRTQLRPSLEPSERLFSGRVFPSVLSLYKFLDRLSLVRPRFF